MVPVGRYLICLNVGQHYSIRTNTNDRLQTRINIKKSPRVQYHPSRVSFSCRLLPSPEPLEHIDLYLLKAG